MTEFYPDEFAKEIYDKQRKNIKAASVHEKIISAYKANRIQTPRILWH